MTWFSDINANFDIYFKTLRTHSSIVNASSVQTQHVFANGMSEGGRGGEEREEKRRGEERGEGRGERVLEGERSRRLVLTPFFSFSPSLLFLVTFFLFYLFLLDTLFETKQLQVGNATISNSILILPDLLFLPHGTLQITEYATFTSSFTLSSFLLFLFPFFYYFLFLLFIYFY